ncbi:P-loop containing nucleoside triphosphate hydrolase protein [Syncephalis fuscata]|nr:P-loop containing nucleoside triphosphate hydrolase protein [Syncephalis fuscata]
MTVLKAENITRTKDDGTPLFREVSFGVEDGEILVIRGPSGVGKSTMLRCIAQLDDLDDGSITLDGRMPDDFGIPVWRTHVAYVPQRPATLPGTPLDFYKRVCTFAANDSIDVGLKWNLSESVWHADWSRLSGGEAQRASLAIAVALEPEILLLDEPTSALDPETCRLVEDTILSRSGGCIWITHDPLQADRVATQILTLRRLAEGGAGGEAYQVSQNQYGTFRSTNTDCTITIEPDIPFKIVS